METQRSYLTVSAEVLLHSLDSLEYWTGLYRLDPNDALVRTRLLDALDWVDRCVRSMQRARHTVGL